jgi:hypothetical protein
MLKKCMDSLKNAQVHLEIADRMSSFAVGVVGENRLLAKVLVELQKSVSSIIDSFVYYEAFTRRVNIPGDKERRAQLFFNSVSVRYLSKKQTECMKEILKLTKKHKNAHLEFVKKDKFVIFGADACEILTSERLKMLIAELKSIISGFPLKT